MKTGEYSSYIAWMVFWSAWCIILNLFVIFSKTQGQAFDICRYPANRWPGARGAHPPFFQFHENSQEIVVIFPEVKSIH
jgi:hypothetical protein